jgi:hypothetical protein
MWFAFGWLVRRAGFASSTAAFSWMSDVIARLAGEAGIAERLPLALANAANRVVLQSAEFRLF